MIGVIELLFVVKLDKMTKSKKGSSYPVIRVGRIDIPGRNARTTS